MLNRLKHAWRVLWGEPLGYNHPYRFVQLMYYRDNIVALDGMGDLYLIRHWGTLDEPSVELWLKNPVRP